MKNTIFEKSDLISRQNQNNFFHKSKSVYLLYNQIDNFKNFKKIIFPYNLISNVLL